MIKSIGMNKYGSIAQSPSKFAQVSRELTHVAEVDLDRDIQGESGAFVTHAQKVRRTRSFSAKVIHNDRRKRLEAVRRSPVRHTTAANERYLTTMEWAAPASLEIDQRHAHPVAAQEAYFHAWPHRFSSSTE